MSALAPAKDGMRRFASKEVLLNRLIEVVSATKPGRNERYLSHPRFPCAPQTHWVSKLVRMVSVRSAESRDQELRSKSDPRQTADRTKVFGITGAKRMVGLDCGRRDESVGDLNTVRESVLLNKSRGSRADCFRKRQHAKIESPQRPLDLPHLKL